jgi:hypothetical protein
MRRKTFDGLLVTSGLVLAIILAIGGGMLLWAHTFVSNEVHDQLAAQKIFFPAKGSEQLQDPAVKPYLSQYAGQQLVTGAQAKAFADHYIAVHLTESTDGKTYSELSALSRAAPDDAKLSGQVATAFKGETLRGMLLNAYAFGTMATIALYGAIVAFAGAGLLFLLALLGIVHARRISPETQIGAVITPRQPVSV